MTVEIIHKGTVAWECECRACHTLFRFEPSDCAVFGTMRAIDCPLCKRTCYDEEWKWPKEDAP